MNAPVVNIDFPSDGEKVRAGHYAIRVAADGADEVEVSIDRAAWKPCRNSAGYYWMDFWPQPGEIHEVRARARKDAGPWGESVRVCEAVED